MPRNLFLPNQASQEGKEKGRGRWRWKKRKKKKKMKKIKKKKKKQKKKNPGWRQPASFFRREPAADCGISMRL